MMINKAQGQSLQHVGLDFRTPVFTHEQFYVAASRVTSVHNIKAIWDPNVDTPVTKDTVYVEVLLINYISNYTLQPRSTDGGPQSRLCVAQTGLRSICPWIYELI
jgi:hypothetical protein